MNLKNYLFVLLFTFGSITCTIAQDIHYTMWDMSPLLTNPSFTGAYLGSARIGGIYRSQWNSFSDTYSTPSFYIDAPIIRGIKKNDWIGVGGVFFSDKAGSIDLKYGGIMGSAAYHLGLNKAATTVLTLGVTAGQRNRSVNKDKARFEDEIRDQSTTNQDDPKFLQDGKNNFTDFGGGLLFKTMLNKQMEVAIGLSVGHINQGKYNLFRNIDTDLDKRPMLTTLHGQFNIGLNTKWDLTPQFFYQTTGGATEISVQSWTGYKINENYKLRGGLGYRLGDAMQILLGVDNKDLRITAAYDVNISDLSGSSKYHDGFEIAAWYIVKIYKKPDVKPAILCPKL